MEKNKCQAFTQIENNIIENKNISLKAKGLYLIIKNLITIPNFVIRKSYIQTLCAESQTAFNSAWNELKALGLLVQEKHIDETGKFFYTYTLNNQITEISEELKASIEVREANKKARAERKKKALAEKVASAAKENGFNFATGRKSIHGETTAINNTNINNTNNINTAAETGSPQVKAIEESTHLKLTAAQKHIATKWDIKQLVNAIAAFKAQNGQYFKFLGILYKDMAKGTTSGKKISTSNTGKVNLHSTGKMNGVQKFLNISEHDFNYAKLEELEEEYITNQLTMWGK